MGSKAVEPKLYLSFSLDAAVPDKHVVRRLAAAVDFGFVRSLVGKHYSHTGQPSVDPVVLFKLWLLGYLFNIRSDRFDTQNWPHPDTLIWPHPPRG